MEFSAFQRVKPRAKMVLSCVLYHVFIMRTKTIPYGEHPPLLKALQRCLI